MTVNQSESLLEFCYLESYEQWAEHIKKIIPSNQLIIYKPGDGWDGLCKFLEVPVPEQPYPSKNDRATFQKNKGVKKGD